MMDFDEDEAKRVDEESEGDEPPKDIGLKLWGNGQHQTFEEGF